MIKIVTAFFDIGRGDRNTYKRTNEQYLAYFKFWARLRNEMVVYCSPEYSERILKIRSDYGLRKQTEVVPLKNVFGVEADLFKRMQVIERDASFKSFRYRDSIENTAKYSYIMLMKWWCVADAASREERDDCFLAWVDFGYNHGGDRYTESKDFDFYWEYSFPRAVNIFCLADPDQVSLIDSLQFLSECCIGHTAIIRKDYCRHYWEMMLDAMNSLVKIGCIDDDQMLMLMVYRQEPGIHSVVICDWFEDFQRCSNQQFSVVEKDNEVEETHAQHVGITRRIIGSLMWCYHRLSDPEYPPKSDFLKRMDIRQKRYYG